MRGLAASREGRTARDGASGRGLTLAVATTRPSAADNPVELRPDDPVYVKLGKKIYMDQCASCHGVNLEGQAGWRDKMVDGMRLAPPHDKSGHTWHHPDALLFKLTKYGFRLQFIGFSSVLSTLGIIVSILGTFVAIIAIFKGQQLQKPDNWIKSRYDYLLRQNRTELGLSDIHRELRELRVLLDGLHTYVVTWSVSGGLLLFFMIPYLIMWILLKIKTSKIDQLCKQLLQQEQSHKEQTKKKEALLDEEVKSANVKTDESKTQCGFLKDQMAALKVEGDLQIQKVKMEFEMEMNSIKGQLDQKAELVTKLKEDLGNKEEEVELLAAHALLEKEMAALVASNPPFG